VAGDRLLGAYHRLPPPAWSAAATVQGARLRWWRYGRGSEPLVEAALARERWSADRWQAWQQQRLADVLARARRDVPWYRRWWDEHDTPDPDLAAWPVLAKDEVRRDPSAFLSDLRPRRTYHDRTSGTTGTPLSTWAGRRSLQAWFALHEARTRRWHGASRHDRWALLGGQAVVPGDRDRPPYWVHNRAGGQLYLSGQHVSSTTAVAYAAALRRHRPTHLVAYPSMAAALAVALQEAGEQLDGPALVVANAEPVTAGQRQVVHDVFGAALRETYGMAEMVGGASECPAGRLHWWPEAGVLEVLDDDGRPVPAGQVGRLVLTGLVDDEQVLVRYDVGDRGRGLDPAPCPCGRTLPVLHPVEGRSQDVLVLPDGRRVFWLNPLFYDLPVVQAQVRQVAADHVDVLVVPAPAWGADDGATVVDRARSRLGRGVRVEVHEVPSIRPEATGKVRPVVNEVGPG
jgi:phenylacetate-CoA ligase